METFIDGSIFVGVQTFLFLICLLILFPKKIENGYDMIQAKILVAHFLFILINISTYFIVVYLPKKTEVSEKIENQRASRVEERQDVK